MLLLLFRMIDRPVRSKLCEKILDQSVAIVMRCPSQHPRLPEASCGATSSKIPFDASAACAWHVMDSAKSLEAM